MFEWGGQGPVKGLARVKLIVLGAVLVYQLAPLFTASTRQTSRQGRQAALESRLILDPVSDNSHP